jgi:hypothetical protein
MSDEARVRALRAEIARWGCIIRDPERPRHIIALAGRTIAEAQLELQGLTGEEPSISMRDVEEFEAATRAATQRVLRNEVPPLCGPGTRGNFQPFVMEGETELVDDPTSAALRQRKANRVSIFASPAPLPLGGGLGAGDGGIVYGSEIGDQHCCTNSVPRTKPASLSGATE